MTTKISNLFDEAIAASGLDTDSRFKQYVKWIDAIDETKSNGYSLVGDFVNRGTIQYEIGKPRLLLAESTTGSRNYNHQNFRVVQMNADGSLERTPIHDTDQERGWALRIRGELVELLAGLDAEEVTSPLVAFSDDELVTELVSRGYQVTK